METTKYNKGRENDCKRIQKALASRKIKVSLEKAHDLWTLVSGMTGEQWTEVPKDDSEIVGDIKLFADSELK